MVECAAGGRAVGVRFPAPRPIVIVTKTWYTTFFLHSSAAYSDTD